MKNHTTVEQSKNLLKLGLKPESADMCWTKYIENGDITSLHVAVNYGIVPIDYPCWSTGSLLELLKTRKYCNFITLHSSHSLKWILTTSYYELANWKEKETIGETQIEAVYNMVVWLLENRLF